jgi:DNA-binding IscR family transcriptional regulator
MLEQLLAEIKSGTTTSPITLAERLNTTPRMVEAMLDTLGNMGYLTSISNECQGNSCGACPVAGMCSTNQLQPKIRMLT